MHSLHIINRPHLEGKHVERRGGKFGSGILQRRVGGGGEGWGELFKGFLTLMKGVSGALANF